jgi:hypothetical protein
MKALLNILLQIIKQVNNSEYNDAKSRVVRRKAVSVSLIHEDMELGYKPEPLGKRTRALVHNFKLSMLNVGDYEVSCISFLLHY